MTNNDKPIDKINDALLILTGIKISEISDNKQLLEKACDILVQAADKLRAFQDPWRNSRIKSSIDKEVFNARKIDFKKMETVMCRIFDNGDIVKSLDAMIFGVKEFKLHCEKVGFAVGIEKTGTFLRFIDFEISLVENETKELKTQIENVNLYYQNFIVTKSTRIAYVSLGIASLAFILTIVQILLHVI